jgi:hypothetical protein
MQNVAKRLFPLKDSFWIRKNCAPEQLWVTAPKQKVPQNQCLAITLDKATPRNKSRRRFAHQGRQPVAYRLMERSAVPACGFADCTRAASDPARPVLRPVREELAQRHRRRRKLAAMSGKRGPKLSRGLKNLGECRDGAPKGERARKRMTAVTRIVRGARRTGQRVRVLSSEAPVRSLPTRLSALRPLIYWGSFRAVAWHSSDATKKTRRENEVARSPLPAARGEVVARSAAGEGAPQQV